MPTVKRRGGGGRRRRRGASGAALRDPVGMDIDLIRSENSHTEAPTFSSLIHFLAQVPSQNILLLDSDL